MLHIGWDWASEAHDVTVIDDASHIVDRWAPTHDEAGIVMSIERLGSHGVPAGLPIAIEATHSLVIDRLLAAGHPVVPIHPNAFHATRPRWSASKAKSDPGDSYKLADYLRTEGHRLRQLEPLTAETVALQALVRTRDDHVRAKIAATNQLRALLERHWPGATSIFARLDSDIALDFLDDYPTPTAAARLGEARMTMFCRRHHYSGRRPAAELIERLHQAPIPTGALNDHALTQLVRAQTRLLRTLLATITELDDAISAALVEHPKARLLAPMPRIGQINLAQIVAEVGPILERVLDVAHACAETGTAPVTRASGKTAGVAFRWAVNRRARAALHLWADNSRHSSPWAANLYADARARGKRHPHAIRILARAWLRVMWACWHTNTTYDPTRHGAEQRLNQETAA
jgi:transposase